MADPVEDDMPEIGPMSLRRVSALLGGAEVLEHSLDTLIDAHDLLSDRLPVAALRHVVDGLVVLERASVLETAIGMSPPAFERLQAAPSERLGWEHTARTWTLAAVLATATSVFGSQAAAERWLDRPQMGLNQRRPIDLLATPAGVETVAAFLQRLAYGGYA